MDPDACLTQLLAACSENNRDDAIAAITDLSQWIVTGGVLPLQTGSAAQIQAEMAAIDPDACLVELLHAFAGEERIAAIDQMASLSNWLARNRVMPFTDSAWAKMLIREMAQKLPA
jgi:hypothetical protein